MKTMIRLLSVMVFLISCSPAGPTPLMVRVDAGDSSLADFEMSVYQTTVAEWKEYVGISGMEFDFDEWRAYEGSVNHRIVNDQSPMLNVTFYEAVEYANWLSRRNGFRPAYRVDREGTVSWDKGANGYRLPTSAEWEWAARGGVLSQGYQYPGSNDLDEVAWYSNNTGGYYEGKAQPVGTKKPNELGIYDLFGGAQEWCWDRVLIYAHSRNLPGEWELGSGRFAALWTEDIQDIGFADRILRLTRGGDFLNARHVMEYGQERNVWPEVHSDLKGIRLVKNAR